MLEILYSDDNMTIVNKPCGMLVHRTSIAEDDEPVVLQLLREQTGRMVYPVHRLDRPTSGVLLFAHNPEIVRLLQDELTGKESSKQYVALVRGWINEAVIWNREVKNDKGNLKEAETRFEPVGCFELPFPSDKFPTARYCMVKAFPETGRWHQIRQHLAQMRHYIINDRVHGDGKQNNIFTNQLHIRNMFLHAACLEFRHPITKQPMRIEAPFPEHWKQINEMNVILQQNKI